eukprot:2485432-Alexandrium_andersonii.AAC.1
MQNSLSEDDLFNSTCDLLGLPEEDVAIRYYAPAAFENALKTGAPDKPEFLDGVEWGAKVHRTCLLYTSPSPRD